MSNFSFLEYSFDPSVNDRETIHTKLNKMGFVHRSQHNSAPVGFWSQNQSIILLREIADGLEPRISGIGFNMPLTTLELIADSLSLENSNAFSITLSNSLRILFVPEDWTEMFLNNEYTLIDKKRYSTTGLENFTGIIINDSDSEVIEYFETIGFKLAKESDRYQSLVSLNRRFTVVLDRSKNDGKVASVIADTNDVFKTTACFTVTNVPLRKFKIDKSQLNFGRLNHKIIGYNCLAIGNEEKFTIENFVDNAFGVTDLIFRMRKQVLHITEQTLKVYYDEQKCIPQ